MSDEAETVGIHTWREGTDREEPLYLGVLWNGSAEPLHAEDGDPWDHPTEGRRIKRDGKWVRF